MEDNIDEENRDPNFQFVDGIEIKIETPDQSPIAPQLPNVQVPQSQPQPQSQMHSHPQPPVLAVVEQVE